MLLRLEDEYLSSLEVSRGYEFEKSFCRGFDGNVAQSIAEMSKIEINEVNLSNVAADRRTLAKAFYLFSKADLVCLLF